MQQDSEGRTHIWVIWAPFDKIPNCVHPILQSDVFCLLLQKFRYPIFQISIESTCSRELESVPMRSWILASLFAVGLLPAFGSSLPLSKPSPVVTQFAEEAKLTPDQVDTVLRLARQCGMTEVAEIKTYNIHPSPYFGILLKSPEVIRGRTITYETLNVDYEAWRDSNWVAFEAKGLGHFWASKDDLHKWDFTTFELEKKTIRISLHENFPVDLADKIIAALGKRKIRFANEDLRKKFVRFPFSTVSELGGDAVNQFEFVFTPSPLTWVHVMFSFVNGEILILSTDTTVS